MDSIKQVIVVRKDLNMRKGKIASQCAHASMKVLFDKMSRSPNVDGFALYTFLTDINSPFDQWMSGSFAKVVLYVESEKELLDIFDSAKDHNLDCSMITDDGRTEFHGVKTRTCCAIGPDEEELIDKVTGHLKLL